METTNIIQTNQNLGFLPPLYKGFGKLDNTQSISSLSEKNKKIIGDLQEILVNKNGSNTNRLYVADVGITSMLPNFEHNNIELTKLYTGVIKELREDFDIKLLSTTELGKVMAKFYGLESGLLPKDQLNEHLRLMDRYSVMYFHHLIDEYYQNSILYTPIFMNNNFDPKKMKYSGGDQINLALVSHFPTLTTGFIFCSFWIMLIRYGGLIANYHRGFTPNSRLVIWAGGMPETPEMTHDSNFTAFLALGYDVVRPDWYGFGRSDGEFTPMSCFQTLTDTYHYFLDGGLILDTRTREEFYTRYDEIIIVGSSFGARFVSRIGFYLPKISVIGLFYPVDIFDNMGKIGFKEESSEDLDYFLFQGLKYMYRGCELPIWEEFYQDQRGQSYDEMVQDLSQKNVFIVHGDADECVHVGRSRKLYEQLQVANPSGNYRYLEIPKGGHGGMTKQIGVVEFCKWLNGK